MRYFLALSLFCLTANAQEEPYDIRVGCDGANILVQVAMHQPGTLRFQIPHDYCGSDT